MDNGTPLGMQSATGLPFLQSQLHHEISTSVPNGLPLRVEPPVKKSCSPEMDHLQAQMKIQVQDSTNFHSHSLSAYEDGLIHGIHGDSPSLVGSTFNSRSETIDASLRRVVSYYNEKNKDTVICDPVMLKCNVEQERNICETIYYATFKAFDCDNRTIKEYEARFFRQFFCGRVVIHFCRVKGSKEIPELPFGFANCPKEPAEVRHMPLEKKGLCDRWDHNLWHPDLDPDKIISPDLFQYCRCSFDKICQKNVA